MKNLRFIVACVMLLTVGAGCVLPFSGNKKAQVGSGGFLVSKDGGRSWSSKSTLLTAGGVSTISGLDLLVIEQDPADSSTLYIGSQANGLFYSLDGGESWQRPENDVARNGTIIDLEVDPADICTYYVLKSDRLLKTTTCGREFDAETYVETRTDVTLTELAIDWYNSKILWLGTSSGDIFKSFDAGNTWTTSTRLRSSISALEVSNGDSRVVLVGSGKHGLSRTADAGANWVSYEDQLEDFKGSDKVLDLSQSNNGSTMAMSSDFGLLISKDEGFSWQSIPLVATDKVEIYDVAVAPTNGDILSYGTATTFLRSTSGGSAWSTQDLPTSRATSVLLVDAEDPNTIYMGVLTLED